MCNKFNNCSFCSNDDNCMFDHMGTGDAFCGGFLCNVECCPPEKKCITWEEELGIYTGCL